MPDPTGRVSHLPDMHRGVAWKEPVRVATASNIAITGQGAGAAIDGVTLATGDRILLKNQTAASSNGIYQVRAAGQAALRAFDMDQDAASSVPASEVVGAVVQVVAGGSNGGTFWRTTNTTAPTIGTDAINWLHMPMGGGTAGAPASVSYGSNATDVSGRTYGGASSDAARADHEHLGVVALTSSSSNTLQRPTVNIRAGTNVALTASDTDGNGAFDTITISASGQGGGGFLGHQYVGYNTVGGSWETLSGALVYAKQFTTTTDGLITSIGVYVQTTSDNVMSLKCGLSKDNAGALGELIGGMYGSTQNFLLTKNGGATTSQPRWLHTPVGIWIAAGTYWMWTKLEGTNVQIAYDAGSDRKYTSGGGWVADGTRYTDTDSTRKYSIRASLIT